ncbi:predicted protein [Streptomyces viridosporus ATCC 14672]|uniref:Predicted protein n=1 Tax=Streptomyces viridosporus (strain ATCC 14672 / DSM 40746 / JCM 4963 / KCTC 9882 / NRRL B-12104 / FH 1290) TaxID=566461 RepID=D6A3I9_STRV1|nr:predicted protein [Streptomyces viridosporus ATCC 14672]
MTSQPTLKTTGNSPGDPTGTPSSGSTDGPGGDGSGLQAGLKNRHLSMIAIGGVIGAGLFVGSSSGIAAAGPGILLSYALVLPPHSERAAPLCPAPPSRRPPPRTAPPSRTA